MKITVFSFMLRFTKHPSFVRIEVAHLVVLVSAEVSYAVLLKQLVVILLGKFFFPLQDNIVREEIQSRSFWNKLIVLLGANYFSCKRLNMYNFYFFGTIWDQLNIKATLDEQLTLCDHHVMSSSSSSFQRKRWFSRSTSRSVLSLALKPNRNSKEKDNENRQTD